MDNNELIDSLENAFETGYLHLKRMNFATSKVITTSLSPKKRPQYLLPGIFRLLKMPDICFGWLPM
jgi:hypothetical protein